MGWTSLDDMWLDLLESLLTRANKQTSRDGDVCGEVLGWHGSLDAVAQQTFVTNSVRGLNPAYAAAEFLWYCAATSDIKMIKHYAPQYGRHVGDQEKAYGAYGPRMLQSLGSHGDPSPLEDIISILRDKPESRQAVLSLWSRYDLQNARLGQSDIPSTTRLTFLIRDSQLVMETSMRSNDAWRRFPYDVFSFTCLQRVIAAELGVQVGEYLHHSTSMHLYSRDEQRARDALAGGQVMREPHDWRYLDDTFSTCQLAVELESQLRRRDEAFDESRMDALGSMTRDLLSACSQKLYKKWTPSSRALRQTKSISDEGE